jgi:DNA polymerase-3 subunit beta
MILANVKAFLSALMLAAKVAPAKSTMPALSQVRITAAPEIGICRVVTTDLRNSLRSAVPCADDGALDVAVNAKAILSLVKKLDSDPISLAVVDGKLSIQSGKRKLSIQTFPVADLPTVPTPAPTGITFDKPSFAKGFGFVESSASQDETRPHLAVVRVEYQGSSVKLVATDGHRLHVTTINGTGEADTGASPSVPAAGAGLILDLCKVSNGTAPTVTLGHAADYTTFTAGPHVLVTQDQESRFPPYDRVMPHAFDVSLSCDVEALRGALDLCKSIAEDRNNGMKVALMERGLVISAENAETGTVSEEIATSYLHHGGRETKIGFNAGYILDAIKGRSGAVTLKFGDELDPMAVEYNDDTESMAVVMPLRL